MKNEFAKLTDESLMPFGKYKGKRMIDVPANYLLYMSETYSLDIRGGAEVKQYVEDNKEALLKEIKK